jgi:hypothetical protein
MENKFEQMFPLNTKHDSYYKIQRPITLSHLIIEIKNKLSPTQPPRWCHMYYLSSRLRQSSGQTEKP